MQRINPGIATARFSKTSFFTLLHSHQFLMCWVVVVMCTIFWKAALPLRRHHTPLSGGMGVGGLYFVYTNRITLGTSSRNQICYAVVVTVSCVYHLEEQMRTQGGHPINTDFVDTISKVLRDLLLAELSHWNRLLNNALELGRIKKLWSLRGTQKQFNPCDINWEITKK